MKVADNGRLLGNNDRISSFIAYQPKNLDGNVFSGAEYSLMCTLESLLGNRSRDDYPEHGLVRFFRVTANGKSGLSILDW